MFVRILSSSFCITVIVFCALPVAAQVGVDTGLWEFVPEREHHQAIVQINSSGAFGTGVIIMVDDAKPHRGGFEGYCLTAYHVVENDDDSGKIKIKYQNGEAAKDCRVIAFDKDNDVAIIWVWVPADIKPVSVADIPIEADQYLEISGLGGGSEVECCIRHFVTSATFPTDKETIYANVALLPGDSGGPGFNEQREVVGIVSGGWFWIDGRVKDNDGREVRTTWPARLSNTAPIHQLLADLVQK